MELQAHTDAYVNLLVDVAGAQTSGGRRCGAQCRPFLIPRLRRRIRKTAEYPGGMTKLLAPEGDYSLETVCKGGPEHNVVLSP